MKIIIGLRDITDLVVVDSYKMDSTQLYESFDDGNRVEHRIPISDKVDGQFEVALSDKNCTIEEFMNLWREAETNGYVMATVYVTNRGVMKTINAYYTMTSKKHERTAKGTYVDVLEIKLEER